jgi:hypothetical protein
MRSPAMEDWIDRARRADIWRVLDKVAHGHNVKRRGNLKGVGPCPACGGKDRFSIDGRKGLFYCRKAAAGGDAIALVEYLTGANFLGACEIINGEAPPEVKPGEEVKREDPVLIEKRRREAEADAHRREAEQNHYREKEIARAAEFWQSGVAIRNTLAETYLQDVRGVTAPAGARLRFHPSLKYWNYSERQERYVVLHVGPALLGRIDDNAHRFIGCHCTYLDLNEPKGKAAIIDPETGEILDAKKVRGSQKGGHIHLGGSPLTARHLMIGEGTETTLSPREALLALGRDLSDCLFWSGVNLGNLGGRAAANVVHPFLTRTDAKGRVRRLKVPGPLPDPHCTDPVLMPPETITRVTLLQDGDSDMFTTEQHLRRAAARWTMPGRTIARAWPGKDRDFNKLWHPEREGVAA